MRFLNPFRRRTPSIYLILSFLMLIFLGTCVLLVLPTREGGHISVIDALFMSTSATCVTGLSVIDIGAHFSIWGQVTILALIQMGGLGIMTFSTVFILALGRSISFRSRVVVQDVFAHSPQADLFILLRDVVVFTFSFEAVGTLLLFFLFDRQFDTPAAAYFAIFHAISAFCNAGFSPFSDSLMSYRANAGVNLVLVTMIIFGGIGFMVLHEIFRARTRQYSARRHWNQLSLHTKIVLAMTASLLIGGTLFFLASEWNNTLKGLPLTEKIMASTFQAVTPRTAGFNTLDFASMSQLTLLGTLILMFIGASPGSTGGGIKTTTMGVFLALSRARLSGSDHVHAFKRSITPGTINRAFGIFVISLVIIILGTGCLLISEVGCVPHPYSKGEFLEYLFEATSAFATVGLSMGVTAGLTSWGKFILIVIMFIGRLGPLVIAVAIQPAPSRGRFLYAQEPVMIG